MHVVVQLTLRVAVAFAWAAAAAGCAATVTTADGESLRATSPEFRAYVERVFREQNRVAAELAFALEAAPVPPVAAADVVLATAEQDLQKACAGLNALATRRRDERNVGPIRGWRTAREAPRCEAATGAATEALEGAR